METEVLKIFDRERNYIGTAPRSEVHRLGLWHEVFHCWFIGHEAGIDYIYLQIRSHRKKDYPNLLDITAAGHLLADETVQDGIREVKEEIGISLSMDELVPLGIVSYSAISESLKDNEHAHVFLYESTHHFVDYKLQLEEVSGIVRIPFRSFFELWLGELERVPAEGFKVQDDGSRKKFLEDLTKEQFVQHVPPYFEKVLPAIMDYLEQKSE
ncbi:NUDIX hydrolase [Neobacillus dielmonensis]|uniref:NUDIX hydrolase n=1 Tax=Neobacillus dielmonensis TaxID=1347369 RepID=UPI0005AA6CE1|nr:NUDIX domain-containing protein [Neobacillus dielmonensis]